MLVMDIRTKLKQDFPLLITALVLALSGGALSGLFVAEWRLGPRLDRVLSLVTASSTPGFLEPTPTEPEIEIIPLERRPLSSAYPPAFALRTASGALTLVRRTGSDIVTAERELGTVVALTDDGWLLTTESAITNSRLADLAVMQNGSLVNVERAIRDHSTGLVYLKISTRGLPVTTFVRPSDVLPGTAVWLEGRPLQLRPESIIDTRLASMTDAGSSERALRRFLLTGPPATDWSGAPVWDSGGRLLALLDTWDEQAKAWKAIPVGSIGRDLGSILSSGEIRRASLGVRGLDLAAVTLDPRPASLPRLGVWLRPERKTGSPAISPTGPSAKLLREGDVLERVERDILDGATDLGELLLEYRPGAEVTVYGQRSTQPLQIKITLGNLITSENLK